MSANAVYIARAAILATATLVSLYAGWPIAAVLFGFLLVVTL